MSSSSPIKKFIPNASLNFKISKPISWKTQYKYLRIHLDSKLSWCKYITQSLDRAESGVCFPNSLLAWHSPLSINNKLLLYKSMVRPKITSESVVYASAPKKKLEKIQTSPNKLLRSFTRATRYVHNDVIHRDLKIRPIFA